jgi:hypothetical protein
MSTNTILNILRFLSLGLFQVFILRQIPSNWGFDFPILFFIYPLAIFLLPVRTSPVIAMLAALLLGLFVDAFYGTTAVHASALISTAYARSLVLRLYSSRDGYSVNAIPTLREMGKTRFSRYLLTMLAIHFLFYFLMEAFTFYYFDETLLKTLVNTFSSFILAYGFMAVYNPKE